MAFGLLLTGAWVWSEGATAAKKKLSLKDLLKATSTSSRRSATVAGVRGLSETDAGGLQTDKNFAAVDRLDKVIISEEELNTFIAEGQLK